MVNLYNTVYEILKGYAADEALCSFDVKTMLSEQIRALVEPGISQSDICETTIINVRRHLVRELERQEAEAVIESVILSISSLYPEAVGKYEGNGTLIIKFKG